MATTPTPNAPISGDRPPSRKRLRNLTAQPAAPTTGEDPARTVFLDGETPTANAEADAPRRSSTITVPTFVADENGNTPKVKYAPDLNALVQELIQEKPYLAKLADYPVKVYWIGKGGKSNGVPVFAKSGMANTLLNYETGAVFIIQVSADHCAAANPSDHHWRAILTHELLHLGVKVDDRTEEETPTTRPHDVEMFFEEVADFGNWRADLLQLQGMMRQTTIFDSEEPLSMRGRL